MAAYNGHDNVVALLLEHPKVDPSVCDNDAILEASYYGHDRVVAMLLEHPRVDPSVLHLGTAV